MRWAVQDSPAPNHAPVRPNLLRWDAADCGVSDTPLCWIVSFFAEAMFVVPTFPTEGTTSGYCSTLFFCIVSSILLLEEGVSSATDRTNRVKITN